MAYIDPLDPCLIFYPGELPEDIQTSIDGGTVVTPTNRIRIDPREDIPPWEYEPPGIPPGGGTPTTETGGGGPGPGIEVVWICVNGIPRVISKLQAQAAGIPYWPTAALAAANCEDPPTTLVWVCRNGSPTQVPLNQTSANEPVFNSYAEALAYCSDPTVTLVWVCRDGIPTQIPLNQIITGEQFFENYADALAFCSTPPDNGGGGGDTPIVYRWKCETVTHTVGSVIVTRKVCVSTTDESAPFATQAECLAECGNTIVITQEEPTESSPTNGGETETQPATEYDETEIPATTEVNNFLPNYLTGQTQQSLTQQAQTQSYINSTETTIFAANQAPAVNYLLFQSSAVLGSVKSINEKLSMLTPTAIRTSVKKELSDIAYNLLEPDGRKIPESRMSAALQLFLLQGKARKINTQYLLSLKIRALLSQTSASIRFINYAAANYGSTQNPLINRLLNTAAARSTSTPQVSQSPNAKRGLARALDNKKLLDYRTYTDAKSEHLKLWNILPEDIYAKAVVADQSGNVSKINVKNDITLLSITSGNEQIRIPLNDYTFNISVETASGTTLVPVDSQLHRAYTLNNSVEQACLFDANAEKEMILTVQSPSALDLEMTYNVNESRPNHYVLVLEPSTITDAETKKSAFVRTSLANYRLETDPAVIQDAIEYRIYPWLVMPVYHDDPMLGHFTTSSTYKVEFNDFSLEEFGDDLSGPIFIRKIPKAILVLPTDRYDYLIYNGQSVLDEWNQRSLSFTLSPDPNYYNTGLRSSWTKINLAFPDPDITNTISETGIRATYETSVPIINNTFTNGTEPVRTEHAYRVATNLTSSLNDSYVTNNGMMWSDLYSRMTEKQYKTFRLNISKKMLEKLRKGEKTGTRLVHDKGVYEGSRLLYLRANKSDILPIYLRRE